MFQSSMFWLGVVALNLLLSIHVDAQRMAATPRHVVLLCADARLYSWGSNSDGWLGDGTTEVRRNAVRVNSDSAFQHVSCASTSTVAVTTGGNVFAWGNIQGIALGVPTWSSSVISPQHIPLKFAVKRALVTVSNALFLLEDGSLVVSGLNFRGEFGNDSISVDVDTGYHYVRIEKVKSIYASGVSFFAITEDGALFGWGSNENGLLDSSKSVEHYTVPTRIMPNRKFVSGCVAHGESSSGSALFITDSGDVYVWGSNQFNELGLNEPRVEVPTKIQLPRRCLAIAVGDYHTLALLEDSTVRAWGDNEYGQLGDYRVTRTASPVQPIGLTKVIEIAVAGTTSYAVLKNGTLAGWGNNDFFQLNRDDAPRQYTPVGLPLPCDILTSVYDPVTLSSHCVKPNPATERVSIDLSGFHNLGPLIEASIYSMQGVGVLSTSLSQSTMNTLDLSTLLPGTYYLVIRDGQQVSTLRFVKLP